MKKKLIAAAVAGAFAAPFAASADSGNVTIYGWINEDVEFVETDDATLAAALGNGLGAGWSLLSGSASGVGTNRDFRSQFGGNASTFGFRGTEDVGNGIKVNFQCEQIMLPSGIFGNTGFGSLCGRNSKIGIAGPWGEIMYSGWLTPYNEMHAGWVDPLWDADASTMLTLFGGYGHEGALGYYVPGIQGTHQDAFQFNRRQDGLVQYWTPNWNGFTARVGYTPNAKKDILGDSSSFGYDPYIFSIAANYQFGAGHVGFGYETHEDWSADIVHRGGLISSSASIAGTGGSSDDAWIIHGAYSFDLGSGTSLKIAGMYEEITWEFDRSGAVSALTGGASGLGTAIPFEELDKETWGVSAQYTTGQWRIMGHYQSTDDLDCDANVDFGGAGTGTLSCEDDETGADAWTFAAAYDMSKRTSLYAAWSHVDNDDNGAYDLAISGTGTSIGGEGDSIQLRIQHAF